MEMLLIRIGLGLLMVLSAFEVFRMTRAVNNPTLVALMKKIWAVVGFFGLLRIAGGLVDTYFGITIGLTTFAVYGFWLTAFIFFFRYRRALQSDEVGEVGRQKISESFDNIAAEMKRFSRKLDKVIEK